MDFSQTGRGELQRHCFPSGASQENQSRNQCVQVLLLVLQLYSSHWSGKAEGEMQSRKCELPRWKPEKERTPICTDYLQMMLSAPLIGRGKWGWTAEDLPGRFD